MCALEHVKDSYKDELLAKAVNNRALGGSYKFHDPSSKVTKSLRA